MTSQSTAVADRGIGDFARRRLGKSDTVIAAGGNIGIDRALESGRIGGFVKQAFLRGACIASVCSGRSKH